MPFLTRGKARARQNRPNPPPITPPAIVSVEPVVPVPPEPIVEELNIPKQEVTYRVPKEERLLDLPLEEEILEEEEETNELDEQTYNIMPVDNPVSIGAVLKKKKRK